MTDSRDDFQLLKLHVDNDPTAFPALMRRYKEDILKYALSVVANVADAENVAQETFLKLYVKAGELLEQRQKYPSIKAWLVVVALNGARKILRSRRPGTEVSEAAASKEQAPHRSLEIEERNVQIKTAIEALPEMQKQCVLMFYVEEKSYDDIAKALKLPKGTVSSHLHRAVAALRAKLSGDP